MRHSSKILRTFVATGMSLLLTTCVQAATFTVTNTNDSGPGSLRQAMRDANRSRGCDIIEFSIPGPGPYTIQPRSILPIITDPVVIDGYTQPGAIRNTNPLGLPSNAVLKIELDGSEVQGPGFGTGLITILAGLSTVSGLVINRSPAFGIDLAAGGGNLIEGNYIGTNVTGSTDLANNATGVHINNASDDNIIGGTTPGARNVISGNGRMGIVIDGSMGNLVQGNYIGTDASGTMALGNSNQGIWMFGISENNTIGGTEPGAGNVISANGLSGISIAGTGHVVQGNYIGTDVTGTMNLGNRGNGVNLSGQRGNGAAFNTTIGGTSSGAGNIIAFNGARGIHVQEGAGNAIRSNTIFSNGGLGIDLELVGVTANDAGDGDTGANNLQNFPVLTLATSSSSTTIGGTLNSTANTVFRLEVFANPVLDPSGHGEGETFIGSTSVTTDGSGNTSFMVTFATPVAAGQFITATATDPNNNTSEFSRGKEVE